MIDFDWFDDFDLFDIGLAGAMSEEMADEELEKKKIEKDYDTDQEDEENF